MKPHPTHSSPPRGGTFATLALCGAVVGLTLATQASDLYFDDFESYPVDGGVAFENTQGRGELRIARDGLTATPFGIPNQYAQLNDDLTNDFIRLQSNDIPEASGALTTLSFDFHEPSGSGGGTFQIGYAMEGNILNSGGARLRLGFNDGVISSDAGATVGTYDLDTSYTAYVVFNDSPDPVNYLGRTVAAGEADVWLEDFGTDSPTYLGSVSATNSQTASYRVGLRTFFGTLQELWVDNFALSSVISVPGFVAPPSITTQPASQNVVDGTGIIRLAVGASGTDLSYQWQLDGVDIAGATSEVLEIDTPGAADAGDYTVVVSGPGGTLTSAPATITLVPETPALVEDFESYSSGLLETLGSDWTVEINGFYSVTAGGSGNQFLSCLDDDGDGSDSVSKPLGANAVADGDTSTYFQRVYYDSAASGSLWFGIGLDGASGFGAFRAYLNFANDGAVSLRSGDVFEDLTATLTPDSWHNVWIVCDNASDEFEVFMTTDDRDATLADRLQTSTGLARFGFRDPTDGPLDAFRIINRNVSGAWRVDDLVASNLANLVFPTEPAAPADLGPLEIEIVGGDAVLTWPGAGILQSSSTLEAGSFTDVDGGAATSPYTVTGPLSGRLFFRLRD